MIFKLDQKLHKSHLWPAKTGMWNLKQKQKQKNSVKHLASFYQYKNLMLNINARNSSPFCISYFDIMSIIPKVKKQKVTRI